MDRINPYAPTALRGVASEDRVQRPFMVSIAFDLTPNQFVKERSFEITDDGDFILHAIRIASYSGSFRVQFYDANGYSLSNTLVDYRAFSVFPYPVIPELFFPRSSRIGVSIQNDTNANNEIRIVLMGIVVGTLKG